MDKVRKQLSEKSNELLDLKGKTDSKIEEMTEQAKLDNLEIKNQKERIRTLLNDVREKEGKLNLKEQEMNKMKDDLNEYKRSNLITEFEANEPNQSSKVDTVQLEEMRKEIEERSKAVADLTIELK